MRPRLQGAYIALLVILLPWFAVPAIIFPVSAGHLTDFPDGVSVVVVEALFVYLIALLLSGLRVRLSLDQDGRAIRVPYWRPTDATLPKRGSALLLQFQSIFSRRKQLNIEHIRSVLISSPGELNQFISSYAPGSTPHAILAFRIKLFEHPPFWIEPYPGMKPFYVPELIIAVETDANELIFRSLYTLKFDDVVAFGKRLRSDGDVRVILSPSVLNEHKELSLGHPGA